MALLAGCGANRDAPNTVRGLQVVAIEAAPAEPAPFQSLSLTAWVADSQRDRVADTMIWLCTPVEGRCLEAMPPGSTGLPLSSWARVGRAAPTFQTSSSAWPLFASIAATQVDLPEEVRGKLLVWAVACAPGVCPIIDQVAANPASESEAWYRAAEALADPASWIEALPRDQVSVAVKVVPVDLGAGFDDDDDEDEGGDSTGGGYGFEPPLDTGSSRGPNRAPRIVRAAEYPDDGDVKVLGVTDPDGDELLYRSFVTAGGATHEVRGDQLWVMHQAPIVPGREGALFVVVEDSRGGTGVWTDHPAFDPCTNGPSATIQLEDGAPLAMRARNGTYQVDVPWTLQTNAPTAEWTVEIDVGGQQWELGSSGLRPLNVGGCTLEDVSALRVPGVLDDDTACAALGQLATVRLSGTTYDGIEQQSFEAVVRGALVPETDVFQRYCQEL
jgi:hypothetical protein